MGDMFQMSTGQAHELALAFGRNGWTNADVKKLSEGDMLVQLLPVVQGKAEVRMFGEAAPANLTRPSKLPHYPDGEVFALTLNGDALENQPLQMVRSDGYGSGWRYNGPTVKGTQTRRFKWVAIGSCRTFDEVLQKLKPHGKIPEGQWREAVKEKFQHDGVRARGIADASWVDPGGRATFLYVDSNGRSVFCWSDRGFNGRWRWLVEVSE